MREVGTRHHNTKRAARGFAGWDSPLSRNFARSGDSPLIIINFAARALQIIWWRVNSIRGKEGRKSEGVERGVTRCLPPSRRKVSEVSLLLLLSAFLERGHCVTGGERGAGAAEGRQVRRRGERSTVALTLTRVTCGGGVKWNLPLFLLPSFRPLGRPLGWS